MGKALSRSPATDGANSVNTSSETAPLLNGSFTQNVRGHRGILKFKSALGDFKSQNNPKVATFLLILCDFFRCMAFRTLATWIPFIAFLYNPLFVTSTETTPNAVPQQDMVTKRFQSVHIVSVIVVNLGAVICGLVSDAWIRKTRMLLCGTILIWIGFGYVSGVMFEMARSINCTMMEINITETIQNEPACSVTNLRSVGYLGTNEMVLVFFIIIIVISGSQSLLDTLIPALAGDQMTSKDEVRRLYSVYFWFMKLGDTLSVVFCLGIAFAPDVNTKICPVTLLTVYKAKLTMMSRGMAIFVLLCASTSMVILMIVICMKMTREYRPDISVIVDSAGIWKQAWQRRKYKKEGEGFLSTAQHRNGGNYPENAVKERANLGKFFCVLLCLMPTSYLVNLPIPHMVYGGTGPEWFKTLNHAVINYQIGGGAVIAQGTGLIFIPLVYALTLLVRNKTRLRISMLHRIIAGQVASIISAIFTVTTLKGVDDILTIIPTNLFLGISNALIYIAGYELTILSAPRSMQATAMGMFFLLDGVTSLVNLVVTCIPGAEFTAIHHYTGFYVGIALNTISIFVLIILEKALGLGLREH